MQNIIALVFIVLSGLGCGSYILPAKYMTKWPMENLWFAFAVSAVLVFPILLAVFFIPDIFSIYKAAPLNSIIILILGGIGFGAGQVCFPFALSRIGLGLSFAISLGLATGVGFLLPLIFNYPQEILTLFGLVTIIGTSLALFGLTILFYAGLLRERNNVHNTEQEIVKTNRGNREYIIGIILVAFVGLSSASQNFIFSYTYGLQSIALAHGTNQFGSANIIWPLYLISAFCAFAGYLVYRMKKYRTFWSYKQKVSFKYWLYTIYMGALFFIPLAGYCRSAQVIGELGPVVGWPLFLISIILASNFWSYWQDEWKGSDAKTIKIKRIGLGILILAVIVLGFGSALR
jgi:L-rhamnose-H+ transport protein